MTKPKPKTDKTAEQLQRFKDVAAEVGADPAPGALDRSMKRVDPKAKVEKPKRP